MSGTLAEHHGYLSDARRNELYANAVARSVRPGDVVVDLGCGFGILGLMCLEAGAARVYGIDSTDAIDIARETAARAGFSDRYICLRGRSFELTLPEPADLLICDHVGYFGIDYGIIEMVADARRRILKPGGRVMPRAIDLVVAAARSGDLRDKLAVWDQPSIPAAYRWLRDYAVSTKHAVDIAPAALASPPVTCARLDLAEDQPETITAAARLTIADGGPVDGIAGWFECTLADGIVMTNAPDAGAPINRHQVFLGFNTPVMAEAGDEIEVEVKVRHADSIIAWSARVPRTGQRIRLSTWASLPLSEGERLRPNPGPRSLTARGNLARLVLERVDGVRTGADIEAEILSRHPDLLPDREQLRRMVRAQLAAHTR